MIGALVTSALLLGPDGAAAQSLAVEYQQVLTRPAAGATAAFALDGSRVAASVQHGELTIVGLRPGATHVIVMFGDRAETIPVLVGDPPTLLPPGIASSETDAREGGYHDLRVSTDPRLVQGGIGSTRREGDVTTELAIGSAALFASGSQARVSIPMASYSVRGPTRSLTLFDAVVANSPLTVARSTVRGLHLDYGRWRVRAGYSFFANFQHLLLATDQASVVGVSYRRALGSRVSLTPNVYHYRGDPNRRGGTVGTLLLEARPRPATTLLTELALGRAVAAAAEVEDVQPGRRIWAKFRLAPDDLPSLGADLPNGQSLDGGWVTNGRRTTLSARLASQQYRHGEVNQTTTLGGFTMQRRYRDVWTIQGGPGFADLRSGTAEAPRIRHLTLPIGVGVSTSAFGLNVDYQLSHETERDVAGHLVRAAASVNRGGFHASGDVERQTQAPTATYILAQAPWLAQILEQQGLTARTPEELAFLLQTNAQLASYGYANRIALAVAPVRTRISVNAGWTGGGPAQRHVSLTTLLTRESLIAGASRGAVYMASYAQRLGALTELFAAASMTCHDRLSPVMRCHPVASVSLRRRLQRAALLPSRHRGVITGTVFRDEERRGVLAAGLEGVPAVDVVLDGVRQTKTDASGAYRFDGVSAGPHRVEVRYAADEPFLLTTPSPRVVEPGTPVNFGIGAVMSSIRGVVDNDAGVGLLGVIVRVTADGRQRTAQTLDDGTFVVEGLKPGPHTVTVNPASVPAGYVLQGGLSHAVSVEPAASAHARFTLRPYRSISGRIRVFDRRSGQYVSLANATVRLLETERLGTSDARGGYAFRDLAAGAHTVEVTHDGVAYSAAVTLPAGPASLKDVDIAIVPAVMGQVPRRQ